MIIKSIWILLVNLLCLSICNAQVTEWAQNFGPHSQSATGGIHPNSVKSPDGVLTTVVLENDSLGLFQTNIDGTLLRHYKTDHSCNNYTPLIGKTNGEYALVYSSQLLRDTFWLLLADAGLNTIRELRLEFQQDIALNEIGKLFEYQGELFLTGFVNGAHLLLWIHENGSVEKILESPVEIAFGDDIIDFHDGSFLLSFRYGNDHLLRCVSLVEKRILWEHNSQHSPSIKLEYLAVRNENIVYLLTQERKWEDGLAIETLKLKWLDAQTGELIHEHILDLPYEAACFLQLHDFKYNPHNDKIYVSYATCISEPVIGLFELNSSDAEITNHTFIPFRSDPEIASGIGQTSAFLFMPNGEMIFLYKNFKNELEKSNLHVSLLEENLQFRNTLEINFEPRNSVESFTDLLQIDSAHILITGVVPHPDPNIFWEEVEYFTLLIKLEPALSYSNPVLVPDEILVFPNPAHGQCSVGVRGQAGEYIIADMNGKIHHKGLISEQSFQLDLEKLVPGTYILQCMGAKGTTAKKLIVK